MNYRTGCKFSCIIYVLLENNFVLIVQFLALVKLEFRDKTRQQQINRPAVDVYVFFY